MTDPPLAVLSVALAVGATSLWLSQPGRQPVTAERARPASRSTATATSAGRRSRSASGTADVSPERPPAVLRVAAVLAVGAATWAFVPGSAGLVVAFAAMVVTWWRSRSWEPSALRRRRARIEAELPWVVDLLTAALRAGLGPVEALGRVTDVCHPLVRHELSVPLARLRLGADPVSVWSELARHPQLGRLGLTLRRATESGAPVVEALVRLAEDLRAHRRAAIEVRVRRIEVRAAVPLGLCLLPAFVLLAVVPLVAGSVSQLLGR